MGEVEERKCWTGKSKSGFCGAALYCDKGFKCCAACNDHCNSRCGWLDGCDSVTSDGRAAYGIGEYRCKDAL